jgi:hypothetical protein
MLRVMSAGSMGHRWSGTFTLDDLHRENGAARKKFKKGRVERGIRTDRRARGVSFIETMTGED